MSTGDKDKDLTTPPDSQEPSEEAPEESSADNSSALPPKESEESSTEALEEEGAAASETSSDDSPKASEPPSEAASEDAGTSSGTAGEDEQAPDDASASEQSSDDSSAGDAPIAVTDDDPSAESAGEDDAAAPPPAPPAPPSDGAVAKGDDDDPDDDPDDEDEDEDEDDDGEGQMSFLDHLTELRIRLTRSAIAAIIGFLACYGFSKQLFELLMRPLVAVFPPDTKLIYTALPEAFFTYIKVALVAGVLLASPYIFYQIWSFIAPGLYKDERKYLIPIALCSGIFFSVGAGFGYSVVFPFAFEFFMDFATETIRPMPSLKEYFDFSLKLLFAFGLIFELPLFIFFLARLGIVTSRMLRKFRKYAFLCSFVVSAVLTPPDVVSQTLMAGPLIVLYELSIWVAHAFGKKAKPTAEEENEDEETTEDEKEEASS